MVDEDERATGFSHANEIAKPNYYRVKFDNGIVTEMSPTERGAHLRFQFSKKAGQLPGAGWLYRDQQDKNLAGGKKDHRLCKQ